jgi:transglutaminase-like putative cysteine protease
VYQYAEPVSTSHHEARLAPRDGEHLRTLVHDVEITPSPSLRRERFDYFGNRALHFSIREPHRALEVVATSVVDLGAVAHAPLGATPPWEAVRDRVRTDRRRDVLDAYAFTFDSSTIKTSPALADYAAPSFSPGRPILEAVRDLVGRIHADFAYDPKSTDVSTGVAEVFRRRRGVCQDFAHVAIACLRALGLPARYVSGYLLTRPPPGRPRLVGADASHAWIGAFVPDYGWVDFDPTNDVLPSDEHVTVGYGRDFQDVTPLKGVILGGGRHEVVVQVDVEAPDGPGPGVVGGG